MPTEPNPEQPDADGSYPPSPTSAVVQGVAELVRKHGAGDVLHALLDQDEMSNKPGKLDLGTLVAGIARKRGYPEVAKAAMGLLSKELLAETLREEPFSGATARAARLLPTKERNELAWDLLENQGKSLADWIGSLDELDQKTALNQLQGLYIRKILAQDREEHVPVGTWAERLAEIYDGGDLARAVLGKVGSEAKYRAMASTGPTNLSQAIKLLSEPAQSRLATFLQHELKGREGAAQAVSRVAGVHGALKVAQAACGALTAEEGRELMKLWNPRDPIFDGHIVDSVRKGLEMYGTALADVLLNQLDDDTVAPVILRRLDVVPNEPEGTQKRVARQVVEQALFDEMFRPRPGQLQLGTTLESKPFHPMAAFKVVLRTNTTTVLAEALQLPVQEMGRISRVTVPVAQEDGWAKPVRCYVSHIEYVPAMGDLPEQRVLVVDVEDQV